MKVIDHNVFNRVCLCKSQNKVVPVVTCTSVIEENNTVDKSQRCQIIFDSNLILLFTHFNLYHIYFKLVWNDLISCKSFK